MSSSGRAHEPGSPRVPRCPCRAPRGDRGSLLPDEPTDGADETDRRVRSSRQARAGLLIPLWSAAGEVLGYQSRPDEPRTKDGKVLKFEYPARSGWCSTSRRSAAEHAVDPEAPLWITEGAVKGDALAGLDLGVVALLGVWCWVSNGAALPDWRDIPLKGRDRERRVRQRRHGEVRASRAPSASSATASPTGAPRSATATCRTARAAARWASTTTSPSCARAVSTRPHRLQARRLGRTGTPGTNSARSRR